MIARFRRFLADEARAIGLPIGPLVLGALALHLGVMLRAANPWHPDEHFQILEFAWARAGLAPLADLPWEFAARIRPTLQPALAMGVLEALRALGVASPYAWVFTLRLVSLALALAVLLLVCARVGPTLARPARRALWLAALFLWFGPLLTSRFTSENWSGLALAAALAWIEPARDDPTSSERTRRSDLAVGALLGLAFVLRFQAAFAIVAALAWLAARGAAGRARAVRVCVGAAPMVALGVACDAWFYRAWVFTPWEYLRTNLIEGVASTFGTEPWYWYAVQAPLWMAPPLGFALALLCGVALVARPRSPWVWAAAAFALGHSLIAHKELRFLFPMFYAIPVLAALGVDALARRSERAPASAAARVGHAVGWTVAVQSAVFAALLLTPAIHRGKEFDARFYRFVWESAEKQRGDTLFVLQADEDPYRVWDLQGHVFHHPRVRAVAVPAGAALADLLPPGTPPDAVLVVTRDGRAPSVGGGARYDLVYAAESGYREMARPLGLESSALVRWLERVDRWTDSHWLRRVYRLSGTGASDRSRTS